MEVHAGGHDINVCTSTVATYQVSVLDDRLHGLSVSLETASVEKSRQHEQVNKMKKELDETKGFIQVGILLCYTTFSFCCCRLNAVFAYYGQK